MLNSYKDYNRIIICFVIFCFLGGLLGVQLGLLIKDNIAYADYTEDILNNPTALVNFNQYVENSYINFTMQSGNSITFSNLTARTGDIFYYRITNNYIDANYVLQYRRLDNNDNVGFYNYLTSNSSGLFTLSYDAISFNYYSNSSNNKVSNFNLYNLTLLFGSGNEPNLQQCKDLFVSDFYYYNSGTPISLNSLYGYQQGVDSVISNMKATYNNYVIGSSAFAFNNNVVENSEILYSDEYNYYYFKGVIGVPLYNTLDSGTYIEFDFTLWIPDYAQESSSWVMQQPLYFCYVDENSNLSVIATIMPYSFSGQNLRYLGAFSVPLEVNTLYLYHDYDAVSSNVDSATQIFAVDTKFVYRTLDVTTLLASQYSIGYDAASEYYSNLYKVGGSAYDAIYYKGYYDYPNDDHYTFKDLIVAAIDTPVQAMTNLFDFDILGVNMKTFYLSIFTLCVIFMILKLVL